MLRELGRREGGRGRVLGEGEEGVGRALWGVWKGCYIFSRVIRALREGDRQSGRCRETEILEQQFYVRQPWLRGHRI